MDQTLTEYLGNDVSFDYILPESGEKYLSSYMLEYLYKNKVFENRIYKNDHLYSLYGCVYKSVFGIPLFSHAKIVANDSNKLHIYYFCSNTNKMIQRVIYINMEFIE